LSLVVFSFTSRLRSGGAPLYDNAQLSPVQYWKKKRRRRRRSIISVYVSWRRCARQPPVIDRCFVIHHVQSTLPLIF